MDSRVEDPHRQQLAGRVVDDALQRAVLAETADHNVRRRGERRHRFGAEVVEGARRLDLLRLGTPQQHLVADAAADDVVDERAHIPLRGRRRSPPIVETDEAQPPCELVVGHHEQLGRLFRRRHIRIVAACHSADKGASPRSFGCWYCPE